MTDSWLPRVRDDEWRTHQAAQWAVKTDTQLNDLAHDGWDFDSDAKLEALAPPLAPLPTPPPAPMVDVPEDVARRQEAEAAPTDWVQRSEQQLASMGSFLPVADEPDPNTISTPLPAMRQPSAQDRREAGLSAPAQWQGSVDTAAAMGRQDAETRAQENDARTTRLTAGLAQSADVPEDVARQQDELRPQQQTLSGIREGFQEMDRSRQSDHLDQLEDIWRPVGLNLSREKIAEMDEHSTALAGMSTGLGRVGKYRTPATRLTPEDIAKREADVAANRTLFDAFMKLGPKQGMSDAVDELQFRQGEGVAVWEKFQGFLTENPGVKEALERGSISMRVAADMAAGAVGGATGYLTAPDGATEQGRLARGLGGFAGGVVAAEGGQALGRGLRNARPGSTGIGTIEGAPVTDARGRLLSGSERLDAGGELVLPPPRLSQTGEKARRDLIDKNIRSGMSNDDAAEKIDTYIAKLQRGQQVPPDMLDDAERTTLVTLNDTLGTYARLNLLMSPLTHARNVVSTAATIPWQYAEGFLAPALEPIFRAAGKTGEARYLGETAARATGQAHAFAAASRNMLSSLRYGDELLETAQTGRSVRGAAPTGGNVISRGLAAAERGLSVGFRPLSAADAFFKTVFEGGELYSQAYRTARNAGLKGQALDDEVLRIVQNPSALGDDVVKAVEKAGKYHTYTSDPNALVKGLTTIMGKLGPAGTAILPFIRTPVNAILYDLERSPLGVASVVKGMANKSVTSGEMADKTARALMGTGIAYGLYKYAEAGNVTGPLPSNPTERDAWDAEGKKPYSVKIGDSWWDLRMLPGLGATVALAGGFADAQRKAADSDQPLAQTAGRYAMHMAQVLGQRPLLGTLTGLLDAIDNPDQADSWWERTAASSAGMYLPASSLGRYIRGFTDDTERAPQGIGQRLAANYPGTDIPEKRTAFGDVKQRSQTGAEALINPFRRSTVREGIRRFDGANDAADDTRIAAILTKVNRWRGNRDEYPEPTDDELDVWAEYRNATNPEWTARRAEERSRVREEKMAR
ncbi:MAG TPA: hypothetical protein VNM48_13065, partial [Chloroflexota bacterium]|nr:hypothetical protein [Chloroflexota bacterium]